MWQKFVIYGITGWVVELFWTGLGSLFRGDASLTARSYLWMYPIYGLAVFFEPVHDRIRHRPWYQRGLLWLLLIWVVEYLSGWALLHLVGQIPWDYSAKTAFDVNGLIRLDYAPAWFAAGLLFEKLHDFLDSIRVMRIK